MANSFVWVDEPSVLSGAEHVVDRSQFGDGFVELSSSKVCGEVLETLDAASVVERECKFRNPV